MGNEVPDVFNRKVSQVDFAAIVGVSKQAVSEHVKSGVLADGATLAEWLTAYCDRLRTEAAGRAPSDARQRRDEAQAMEAEVNAQLKTRELYRQDGLILDYETVREVMADWVGLAKNEFNEAVRKMVTAIESKHGISIEPELYRADIDSAARIIGGFEIEPRPSDSRGS